MIFRRIRGRIVPIREQDDARRVDRKGVARGLATGLAGAALSIGGSALAGRRLSKFGRAAKWAGMLGAVFTGEAIAAEGFDRATESLRLPHRKEQNIKNFTAGALGVVGLLSGAGMFKRRAKIVGGMLPVGR
jgi:hypothetical protein